MWLDLRRCGGSRKVPILELHMHEPKRILRMNVHSTACEHCDTYVIVLFYIIFYSCVKIQRNLGFY